MRQFFTRTLTAILLAVSIQTSAQTTPPANNQQRRQPRPDTIISNNGLKGNLNAHDPCMIKAGDTYYVLTTGMSIKSSKDMVN